MLTFRVLKSEFLIHSGPENLKKFRQKNSWKQINQTVLNFFPVQKLVFDYLWNCQKMEFGQK